MTGPQRPAGTEDDVDQIVLAWNRERPDLDVSPLEVLSRVSRLSRHLDRARAAAFAEHGLEGWEFDVLAALRRAGHPHRLTPGQLISQTMVSSGTMTNRVDRLEKRSLVARHRDPSDGRGVLVELTPAGAELVDVALTSLLERERDLLVGLDQAQRDNAAQVLRAMLAQFEAQD